MEINYCSRFRVCAAYVFSLCAFVLLGFSAPRCAASVGPVITSATVNGKTVGSTSISIPPAGGSVTVTAKVADAASALSSVYVYETYDNTTTVKSKFQMSPGSNGIYTTAPFNADLNASNQANGETFYIVATDQAGNQTTTLPVATQTYASTPPTITTVTVNGAAALPNPILLPAAGGLVTVTAKITDPYLALTSVYVYETYDNSNQVKSKFQMSPGSNGIYTTAPFNVDLNASNQANGETFYIVATDQAGNQTTTLPVATQTYASTPPSITNLNYSPASLPIAGGLVTVSAKVTDLYLALTSVYVYETYDNSNQVKSKFQMSPGSNGIYTATISVDTNTSNQANGETLYIVATDQAGNQTISPSTSQGYFPVAPFGSLPVLITSDASQPVLTPSSVAAGGPELPLTINGINFASGAYVLFNGVKLIPTNVLGMEITVGIPSSLIAQQGSYAVTVVDPPSNVSTIPSGASNSVNFLVK